MICITAAPAEIIVWTDSEGLSPSESSQSTQERKAKVRGTEEWFAQGHSTGESWGLEKTHTSLVFPSMFICKSKCSAHLALHSACAHRHIGSMVQIDFLSRLGLCRQLLKPPSQDKTQTLDKNFLPKSGHSQGFSCKTSAPQALSMELLQLHYSLVEAICYSVTITPYIHARLKHATGSRIHLPLLLLSTLKSFQCP